MKFVDSNVELLGEVDAADLIYRCEYAARNCYQSHDKMGEGTGEKLIRSCLARGHESIIEHATLTFEIVCDRGVSHELVRHRIAAYSQESTRYCNYSKDKFGNELTFVYPWWTERAKKSIELLNLGEIIPEEEIKWVIAWHNFKDTCQELENRYNSLISIDMTPDAARAVLPNCLKTKVVCSMNMREIRHFLKLRAGDKAHPDIRVIANKLAVAIKDAGLGIFIEDIDEIQ